MLIFLRRLSLSGYHRLWAPPAPFRQKEDAVERCAMVKTIYNLFHDVHSHTIERIIFAHCRDFKSSGISWYISLCIIIFPSLRSLILAPPIIDWFTVYPGHECWDIHMDQAGCDFIPTYWEAIQDIADITDRHALQYHTVWERQSLRRQTSWCPQRMMAMRPLCRLSCQRERMNNLRRSVFTLSAVLLIASSHRKAYNYTWQQVGLPANSELAQLNLIRAEDTDRHAAEPSVHPPIPEPEHCTYRSAPEIREHSLISIWTQAITTGTWAEVLNTTTTSEAYHNIILDTVIKLHVSES